MTQPILVVDFGAYQTSAAVVTGTQLHPVPCPISGAMRWPSAVCLDGDSLVVGTAAVQRRELLPRWFAAGPRQALDTGEPIHLGDRTVSATDVLAAYLKVLRAEAEQRTGQPIERLALTVPSAYGPQDPRRQQLLALAADAGFPDAELVGDAVSAVVDPHTHGDFPDGALLLVCDLGASWSVALTRVDGEHPVVLGQETSGGGQDFDLLLVNDLRAALHEWLAPALHAGGETGLLARFAAADFVRSVKHRLSETDEVTDRISPHAPTYRMSRAGLERLAEPALRWLIASCRAVVARAGFTLNDVTGVLLVGGASRLPVARAALRGDLQRPLWQPTDPELAVIRGAARWAGRVGSRRIAANAATWRMEPLTWEVPEGRARLVRWLVGQGQQYGPGTALAQVRAADDRVYDLTAAREGILVEQRIAPGALLTSDAIAAMTRTVKVIAGDRAAKRHQMRVAGDWLLTPDHELLVECERSGVYVRMRAISSGAVVREVRPMGMSSDSRGKVFVGPDDRLALVSWDPQGRFSVWDVMSGQLTNQFRAAANNRPVKVLVHEGQWRLIAEADRKVHVGRYVRDVATMWDLFTGTVIEEMVGEDLNRRYAGYTDHSTTDGFASECDSPDGRLRAGTARSAAGLAVWLHETGSAEEVFRTDLGSVKSARTAFSADGHHLLAQWSAADTSCVDVWQV
ncbi:Hsp70 family protein [Catellatospora tritici]|uniref:Hsp70 family protein n=1 Tax=Catellatospora tritici TaxID=2851566 RepID=UPI001C2DD894|nr:Hsp70 family protein [Catellatospora tritici]MBV1854482.1 Hsp70 family protein [Catellatospora tritici]